MAKKIKKPRKRKASLSPRGRVCYRLLTASAYVSQAIQRGAYSYNRQVDDGARLLVDELDEEQRRQRCYR